MRNAVVALCAILVTSAMTCGRVIAQSASAGASPAPAASVEAPPVLPVAPPAAVPPAQLAYPQGILLDTSSSSGRGDLLVSDKDASAIFRINTTSKEVKLVAQWSPALKQVAKGPWMLSNFQGMLLDPDGSIVVPDPSARSLWRVLPSGEIKLITQDFLHFDTPQGICSDGQGNYVIADPHRHSIVKVAPDGRASYVVEGDLTTGKPLRNPRGIVRDKDGSYVIAEGSMKGVYRVTADGKVVPIAEGPPFQFPQGIVQDADGSFLVPDNYARSVFRVTADGKVAPLVAGDPLKNPRNLVPDGKGGYWLTDPGIPAIVKIADGHATVWLPITRPPAGK